MQDLLFLSAEHFLFWAIEAELFYVDGKPAHLNLRSLFSNNNGWNAPFKLGRRLCLECLGVLYESDGRMKREMVRSRPHLQ